MKKPGAKNQNRPGFCRRIAAILYDALLLLGLLFLATAVLLPFNNGQAFTGQQIFYPFYLLAVSFGFFGWFWTHGGQTLGMRAWKIKVLSVDRQSISWKQALLRFCGAIVSWLMFGCGFLRVLTDNERHAWHDRFSGTFLYFDR